MTSKQRAYLRGLASKEEAILLLGKGGMNDNIIKQASDALEARELIKLKCLESCELSPLEAVKATVDEKLTVERIENELYITSEHEMTKEHYISFVAFVNGDTVYFRKLFPEWNMETRLPFRAHGMLMWYCNQHGLFYQYV